jgi:Plasmid encoded RepA protein
VALLAARRPVARKGMTMEDKTGDNEPGLRPIQDLLPGGLKPPSAQQRRLFDLSPPDGDEAILYQHSVLCQTCLPYRDPGDEVRLWARRNGFLKLEVQAGRAYDGRREDFVDVGLPYGPKPRLVLYHLNAEALRTQSPVLELEDSLTAFVKRTLGLDAGGRNIRTVKDQLSRLSASDFRIGTSKDDRSMTLKGSIVEGFELWTPRDVKQRVLWPTTIQFSPRYFESLMKHAVPLNETAIARLSHNAMALDVYTWLAQRLHRVEEGKTALVPWPALHEQFGHGYERLRDFRRVFQRTLRQVKAVYPESKFDVTAGGITLKHSRSPIGKRLLPMSRNE